MASTRLISYLGGIGRALSARDYRIYWYAHVFSSHGVWMHRMAVGVLIYQLTGSPAWLGFVGFVYALPLMVLGPIAGAIADRFGIRRTAVVALAATVALTVLMSALTLARLMTPALLATLVVLLGILHAFDFPVRQVLIQLLVGRERMSAAIALNSTTFNTASFTGPMLGAGVLALGEATAGDAAPGIIFFVYGLTAAALMWAILRTRMRDRPSEGGDLAKLAADVLAGLRYTLGHEGMRLTLALWVSLSLLAKPYMDLLPGYALAVFERGTEGVGTMMAASGLGALCFSMVMALRGRTEGLTRILVAACAGGAVALMLFAGAPGFWLAAAAMACVGGTLVVGGIASQSLIQNATDGVFRTRVISVYFALINGAQAIGLLLLGWVAELTSFRIAFAAGAALSLVTVFAMAPGLWRRQAALEAAHAEAAPAASVPPARAAE